MIIFGLSAGRASQPASVPRSSHSSIQAHAFLRRVSKASTETCPMSWNMRARCQSIVSASWDVAKRIRNNSDILKRKVESRSLREIQGKRATRLRQRFRRCKRSLVSPRRPKAEHPTFNSIELSVDEEIDFL